MLIDALRLACVLPCRVHGRMPRHSCGVVPSLAGDAIALDSGLSRRPRGSCWRDRGIRRQASIAKSYRCYSISSGASSSWSVAGNKDRVSCQRSGCGLPSRVTKMVTTTHLRGFETNAKEILITQMSPPIPPQWADISTWTDVNGGGDGAQRGAIPKGIEH